MEAPPIRFATQSVMHSVSSLSSSTFSRFNLTRHRTSRGRASGSRDGNRRPRHQTASMSTSRTLAQADRWLEHSADRQSCAGAVRRRARVRSRDRTCRALTATRDWCCNGCIAMWPAVWHDNSYNSLQIAPCSQPVLAAHRTEGSAQVCGDLHETTPVKVATLQDQSKRGSAVMCRVVAAGIWASRVRSSLRDTPGTRPGRRCLDCHRCQTRSHNTDTPRTKVDRADPRKAASAHPHQVVANAHTDERSARPNHRRDT